MGLYASEAYLEAFGPPTREDLLSTHTVIGLDRDALALRTLASLGVAARREDFCVRSDAQAFGVQAARDGVGVGGLHVAIAARHPDLVRVLPELPLPPLPLWLVAHADLRRSPRVRAVYDLLAEGLAAFYAGEKKSVTSQAPPYPSP
jgi:DNA-binding transcriptional LysR family regulator